jgi:hypothetical protein
MPMTPYLTTQPWDKAVWPFRDGAQERKDWADDFLYRMKNVDGVRHSQRDVANLHSGPDAWT